MICKRCGYCCIAYDVIIIKPEYIDTFGPDNLDPKMVMHKPCGEECPHLSWDGDVAVCKVHHLPWFDGTPCSEFSQIGYSEDPCRIGEGILTGKLLPARRFIKNGDNNESV